MFSYDFMNLIAVRSISNILSMFFSRVDIFNSLSQHIFVEISQFVFSILPYSQSMSILVEVFN